MNHGLALSPEVEIGGHCLSIRLRMLNRLVTSVYDDALRPFGLRTSQLNLLAAIAVRGPLRGVELAAMLGMDTSTVSRDLDRLIANEWLVAGAEKGRARSLEVSTLGRELIARVLPAWREAQVQAKVILSPALAQNVVDRVDAIWRDQTT